MGRRAQVATALVMLTLLLTACTNSGPQQPARTAAPPSVTTLLDRPIPSAGCGRAAAIRPGTTARLTVPAPASAALGSRQRVFLLHVPAGYRPRTEIPLIVMYHGAGGTAAGTDQSSGLSALADQQGFLVAYPQGLHQEGGNGNTGWAASGPSDPEAHGVDDGLFTSDMITAIQDQYCADPARIYATGMSNGGNMTGYAACVLAGRIAAFAPVEGEFFQIRGGCDPARPPAILDVHVSTDPAAPYAGMSSRGSPDYYATPVPVWLRQWAARDRCQATSARVSNAPFVKEDWVGCPAGADVSGWEFPSGGHSWFGYTGVAQGTRMLLGFFLSHPLRPAPRSWTPGPVVTVPAPAAPPLAVRGLRMFPLPGRGAEPFDIARSAAGDMWFTEFAADKIGKITPDGTITEYRVPTPRAGPFQIAPGPGGAMWFTEYNTNRIGKITQDGQVTELGLPGPTYGGLGITGTSGGSLYVADPAGSVDRIGPDGKITRMALAGPEEPFAVTTTPGGMVWLTRFHGYFEFSRTIMPLAGQPVTLPGSLSDVDAISAGPDGRLWFSDFATSTVGELSLRTRHVSTFAAGPAFGGLTDIAAADGAAWFTEQDGIVGRVTSTGTVTELVLPQPGSNPDGIAAGSGHTMWVTETAADAIAEITYPG